MLEKDLIKLGLEQKESIIYLSLLELGEANIGQIAKKSSIKRTTVYDIIESLKSKGLVSQIIRNKKRIYYAENPNVIEEQLEEKKKVFKSILPELLSVANFLDKKPKIRFFEGIEGIKNVYKDTLKYPNQEILMWGAPVMFDSLDPNFMWEYYVPKRIEKKIWLRGIGPDNETVRKIKDSDEKQLRKTKLIRDKSFPIEVEINLYAKNKIAIMSFEEKIGLIIESQKIYTTLKSIFEMNWQMLP